MLMNSLTKPILQITSHDYAKMLEEASLRNRHVAQRLMDSGLIREGREITPKRIRKDLGTETFRWIFNKDGSLTEKIKETLIDVMHDLGYDYDSMMHVSSEEFMERAIEIYVDPSYVPRCNYFG
ncbi:hypothetical protein IJ596_06040 [bacterium]|nr:hypothetical protein [bacterium]